MNYVLLVVLLLLGLVEFQMHRSRGQDVQLLITNYFRRTPLYSRGSLPIEEQHPSYEMGMRPCYGASLAISTSQVVVLLTDAKMTPAQSEAHTVLCPGLWQEVHQCVESQIGTFPNIRLYSTSGRLVNPTRSGTPRRIFECID